MSGAPDPKPARRPRRPIRTKNVAELKRARMVLSRACAACGVPAATLDHVIPRGSPYFGDDSVANSIMLCGSGTSGCHGAKHGSPYTVTMVDVPLLNSWTTGHGQTHVEQRERRDEEWVRRRIGRHLVEHRPDFFEYAVAKLGINGAEDYLKRRYFIHREEW